MIAINELTVSWGAFTLLDHINLHIGDNEKIGLVGKNGAGKSTLLKVILGQALPTSGAVVVSKGQRIGYLPQQMEHSKEHSVIDETLKAFDELFRLQSRIDEVSSLLAQRTDYESASYNNLIVELNNLQDKVAIMESEPPHSQVERVLMGLGFKREEFNRPTAELSQGWNMRIELAKILLSKPDILLLDEPTNHLDIESIQWFEEYLKTFRGSVVLISHDRKFLDNITKRTVEITLGKINDYKVPYSQYKVLRSERMEQQRSAYENQQRMIEKSEEFIERFRYKATKSNQVQSRIKALDKLERIEIEVDDTSAINVKFPPAPRSGQVVFKTNDAVLGYRNKEAAPPKVVLQKSNIVIERGEKVAFVGRNGEGKTTMMRVLIGELEPLEGQAENGYNVSLGYYAQNQEDILVKSDTVFSTLDNIAVGDIRTKLRDILGAFLFKGEDVDKKVAVLSGGERARLAMAKLMLKPYNLLALDEPTNHMDILSKEILKNALKKYDGTLVIVS
ncbi:MAG: ABC-F family ATP-binding cassette domain-containing protein, partial [Bacteroidales bacterium]|nr:ABC-F family ATP-binding cassette domain-containing protein [Bacteroidales bacterium]